MHVGRSRRFRVPDGRIAVLLAGLLLTACATPSPVDAAADTSDPVIAALRDAAAGGDADSQYALALRYLRGEGLPRDPRQALVWFRRAAAQGHAAAQRQIGNAHARGGAGLAQSWSEAARWYRMAAQNGDILAAFNLARLLERGRGVERDATEAVRWYRKAAEAGLAKAQTNLGILLYRGDGAPRDLEAALRLFLEAARRGDAIGAYNAGVMVEKGRGTEADAKRALALYRQAAELDYRDAQWALGRLIGRLARTPEEHAAALFWFEVATLRGGRPPAAADAGSIDRLRSRLSVAEQEAVRRRALGWRPSGRAPAAKSPPRPAGSPI